jgi:hypothetical protein
MVNYFYFGGKIDRVDKSDLLYSFNEHTKAYKPNNRNWEARRLCSQFKKLVHFSIEKRRGSGAENSNSLHLMSANCFFADKYSLDSNIFGIK